jgi:hypothetical protein
MNIVGFFIVLAAFVVVFFYPEVAGGIFARIVNGFRAGIAK